MIPVVCICLLMNMTRIQLAFKGYNAQDRKIILSLDRKDIKDILNYPSIIHIDKWNSKTNDGHYLLYDEFKQKNKKSIQSIEYYVDSYYKNKDELTSLGYTKKLLFENSDVYTKDMLDVLLDESIPYKSIKKYLDIKGVQIQDLSAYVDSGLSPLKAIMHVSYPGIDSNKADDRTYEICQPDNVLVLVKSGFVLPSTYVPKNLIEVNLPYTLQKGKLVKKAGKALEAMYQAANKKGYEFVVDDTYQSYEQINELYSSAKKANVSTIIKPGINEHQLGLSVDLTSQSVIDGLYTDFSQTPDYEWILANAYKYGYIWRYPTNKEKQTGVSTEPYHFRYVGKKSALEMHEKNWTLEEYIKHNGFTYEMRLN